MRITSRAWTPKTHQHEYGPHPNPEWAGSYACTVCGFRIPAALLAVALAGGARLAGGAK